MNILEQIKKMVKPIIFPHADRLSKVEERLEYLTRCLGVYDGIGGYVNPANIFKKSDGEYYPNYIYPKSLNEYVLHIWTSYYKRSPIRWVIRHKYLAKQFVRDLVGDDHVVKLYGVYDWPEQIEFEKLPDKFVLKATMGWGGKQVIIVKDKSKADFGEIIAKLNKFVRDSETGILSFTKNRLIAEEYLENADGTRVSDMKIYCSMGNIIAMRISSWISDPIGGDQKEWSFYSVSDWKFIPVAHGVQDTKMMNPNNPNVPRPKHLDEIITLAQKMTVDQPLIRLDLYNVGERILVGEMTVVAGGGRQRISPAKYDYEFGSQVRFPNDRLIIEEWIARDIAKYGQTKDLI